MMLVVLLYGSVTFLRGLKIGLQMYPRVPRIQGTKLHLETTITAGPLQYRLLVLILSFSSPFLRLGTDFKDYGPCHVCITSHFHRENSMHLNTQSDL